MNEELNDKEKFDFIECFKYIFSRKSTLFIKDTSATKNKH